MKLKGIELKGTFQVTFYDEFFVVNYGDGNKIYLEDINDTWEKREFDEKRNEVYYEDSDGFVMDSREKELTIKEIEMLLGYKIKIKGERK